MPSQSGEASAAKESTFGRRRPLTFVQFSVSRIGKEWARSRLKAWLRGKWKPLAGVPEPRPESAKGRSNATNWPSPPICQPPHGQLCLVLLIQQVVSLCWNRTLEPRD